MDRSLEEVISERQVRQRLATFTPSSELLHRPYHGLEVDAKPFQRGNTRGRRDRRQNNWPRDGVRKVRDIRPPSPSIDGDLPSLRDVVESDR